MKKNMGQTDRILRVLAAVAVGILIAAGVLTGPFAVILGILAVIFLLTSALSFCPLYHPLKISTRKEGKGV